MLIDSERLLEQLEFAFRMNSPSEKDSWEVTAERAAMCRGLDVAMEIVRQMPEVKPKRESRALLPCKCGGKRREHWYSGGNNIHGTEGLRCMKCGFEVWGKNATDVIRKWNEAVKQP